MSQGETSTYTFSISKESKHKMDKFQPDCEQRDLNK